MDEIIFVVEEAPEGGYTARALGASIFTKADDLAGLHAQVRDAVRCHFDQGQGPRVIRLHVVRDDVIAVCGCLVTFQETPWPKLWRRVGTLCDASPALIPKAIGGLEAVSLWRVFDPSRTVRQSP